MMYGQYHQQIEAYAAANDAAGVGNVFNGGAASILCAIPAGAPVYKLQQSLGQLFFIEFFVDSYIVRLSPKNMYDPLTHLQGIIIWACLDPANPFVSPQSAPFAIGLAYAVMVWGFADVTISTNLARDLGTRMVAAIFYGPQVFTYMNYSWIAILVNVPATLFATGYYELLMRDSLQKIGKGAAVHEGGEQGLALHLTKSGINMEGNGLMEKGVANVTGYASPSIEHKESV